jgi:hypothetical protein
VLCVRPVTYDLMSRRSLVSLPNVGRLSSRYLSFWLLWVRWSFGDSNNPRSPLGSNIRNSPTLRIRRYRRCFRRTVACSRSSEERARLAPVWARFT